MNTRIRKLRKTLDLTQQVFAEKIGLKQNSIALIESGKRNISDQAVLSICREFNVNESWLRTGNGEMFKAAPIPALDALVEEYNLSPASYVMVEKFVNLKPDAQEAIFKYIREVAAVFQTGETYTENPIVLSTTNKELSIDEKVEAYRRELELQEKSQEKSEALPKNA